jgi:hypothetical protein
MGRTLRKARNRTERGGYFGIPHAVLDSPNYRALSAQAIKLLIDLGRQFLGGNNGDLAAAWTMMVKRGWKSRDTLGRALAELLHFGMIEKTRQGGLNRCSLYALTWQPIDDCRGKLDVSATVLASRLWKIPKPPMEHRAKSRRVPSTPIGQFDTTGVSTEPRANLIRHDRRVSHETFQ